MEESKKRLLEEDILELIFKFGLENVENVFMEMKPTIRGRFEERMKIIFSSSSSLPEEKVVEEVKPVVEPVIDEPIPKGTNEKKKMQREAEKRKREENEANGIFAEDLLTEENLRAWKEARHSNAYIAREFIGCREEDVAKAIKKFNIIV